MLVESLEAYSIDSLTWSSLISKVRTTDNVAILPLLQAGPQ